MQNSTMGVGPSALFDQLDLLKQPPIFNFQGIPNPRRILHGLANEHSLLPKLQIDLSLHILTLNMGNVNRDGYVCRLLLEAHKREDDSGKIRR